MCGLSSGCSTAEREGVYDGRALAAVIAANRGHRGSARLGAILAGHVAGTTVTRSGLEERMLALCRGHGLPCPLVNHFVLGVEVDFVFPGMRVLVEADSWRYHRSRAQFARDRERDGILARAGYRVLRFADEQIVEQPGLVAATIATALPTPQRPT
jgi:uncharacterized protein DUF559